MSTQIPKIDRRHNDYTTHSCTYDEQRFHGAQNEYLELLRRRAFHKALSTCKTVGRILDVGCGTGRGTKYLLNRGGLGRIIGLDYTQAMLDRARDNLQTCEGRHLVSLLRGDGFELPFADGMFDLVVSLNFLHMFRFELQMELIQEMTRVCRPGGKVVVELESIHKGLFFTRHSEQRRVVERTKFNSLGEVHRLFSRPQFRSFRVIGTALPLMYRVLHRAPRFGVLVECVAHVPPCNWLAERVMVSAERARTVKVNCKH